MRAAINQDPVTTCGWRAHTSALPCGHAPTHVVLPDNAAAEQFACADHSVPHDWRRLFPAGCRIIPVGEWQRLVQQWTALRSTSRERFAAALDTEAQRIAAALADRRYQGQGGAAQYVRDVLFEAARSPDYLTATLLAWWTRGPWGTSLWRNELSPMKQETRPLRLEGRRLSPIARACLAGVLNVLAARRRPKRNRG